jgi:prepilin-type N-terminal cleavage/methylation domain-containing protein
MIRLRKRSRRAAITTPRPRKGFSLIEVMVAMTMMSVVLLSMGQMATAVAIRGRTNDIVAKRNSALLLEANKLGTVPFANLGTWVTTDLAVSRGNFQYTRKLTITQQSTTRYSIKIVLIPTLDPSKKDSVTFDRSSPPASSPLCVGC